MSKLAKRCSALFIASSLGGLLSACPSEPPPNTNVRPIPSTPPGLITPTPPPGSVIQPPSPGPGLPGSPSPLPSSSPGTPTGLAIATTGLPTAVLNFNYSFGLQVSGGSGSYNWSIVSGNLPRELGLDPNTGQIFGRPTQSGSFEFEVQALDNQSGQVARQRLFILVSDSNSGVNTLSVLTSSLPSGVVDRGYSQRLEVTGGVAPFSWTVSAGALPDGLRLNTSTGEISGTPTLRGEETFTVRVTDGQGRTQSRTLSITINRTDSNITVLTASLPPGVSGSPYNRTACGEPFSGQLSATGGDGDYRWSVSRGTLPPGLTMNSNGNITGTPTTVGSYTFTVRVDDGEENSASKVFTAEISQLLVHNFTPDSGGKGLRMTIFGEGLSSMAGGTKVRFGDVESDPGAVTTVGDCQQFQTNIPENAKTGLITLRNGTTDLGSSSKPFVAEDVVINEVFLNPDSSGNQFVELKNRSAASVSIAGWYLHYTGVDGSLVSFRIPPETPPLATGALTVINIGRNGGTSATDIYTGTGVQEMRFDPLNTTPASALTRLALCKGELVTDTPSNPNCRVTDTDTDYRGYFQFGGEPANGQNLAQGAVNSGVWRDTVTSTLNVRHLVAPLRPVSDNDVTAIDAAHFGVAETNKENAGLLVGNGNDNDKFTGYQGQVVLYYSPVTGALVEQQQRILRTVTGTGAPLTAPSSIRVRLNAPIFESKIQTNNTGDGSVGNGILVDTVQMLGGPNSLASTDPNYYPGDLVNIITGGVLSTVTGLQAGPRIELLDVPAATTSAANASDGLVNGGFEITGIELADGAERVRIDYTRADNSRINVDRTVAGINLTEGRLAITEPLASVTVSPDNTGDGTPDNEIILASAGNFRTGDRALFNGLKCADDAPCDLTLSSNLLRLSSPLAQLQIDDDNTGNGSELSRLSIAYDSSLQSDITQFSRFSTDTRVRINGQERTIQAIAPPFPGSPPRFQLDAPFELTITAAVASSDTVEVANAAGFLEDNCVRLGSTAYRIEEVVVPGAPGTVRLNNALSASAGDTLIPAGAGACSGEPYLINLVPGIGTFTLVPQAAPAARISRVLTSGSIYLAPRTGFLRKYQSIKLTTSDNFDVDSYVADSVPTPGQ